MRSSVTYEEVAAACQDLLAKGEVPTAGAVQQHLGKGSIVAITRLLKVLRDESQQDAQKARESQQNFKLDLAEGTQEARSANDSIAVVEEQPVIVQPVLLKEEPLLVPQVESQPVPPEEVKTEAPKLHHPHRHQKFTPEPVEAPHIEERLEDLSESELAIKIRRLEALLVKEQSRREAAERLAVDAKSYAEAIKAQVAERISELKQMFTVTIEQLRQEARDLKANHDQDLLYYRDQLKAANQKVMSLMPNRAVNHITQNT